MAAVVPVEEWSKAIQETRRHEYDPRRFICILGNRQARTFALSQHRPTQCNINQLSTPRTYIKCEDAHKVQR